MNVMLIFRGLMVLLVSSGLHRAWLISDCRRLCNRDIRKGFLFTDGRYFLQAEKQLERNIADEVRKGGRRHDA